MIKIIHKWLETAIDREDMNPVTLLKINLEELSELALAMGLLEEFRKLLINQVNDLDKTTSNTVLDALVDMEWTKHNISYLYNISEKEYKEHFKKVAEANYKKFCKTEDEAKAKVQRKGNCYYKKRGKYFVVYRTDGKIL